jgi:adenylate kinase family enzyme
MIPKRVHIVGGPGSGKSTLGTALAGRLGVRVFDLDDIALAEGADQLRPIRDFATRGAAVRQLAADAVWVTEGTFLWWTDALFERADVVIWLDPPWWLAAVRILRRHLADYLHQAIRADGLASRLAALRHPHVLHLIAFFRWSAHYYRGARIDLQFDASNEMSALTRAATSAFLEAYRHKTIRLTAPSTEEAVAALAAHRVTDTVMLRAAHRLPYEGRQPR